ncbi:uncharacterized protein K444DRAFT_624191 [Hyaloscypha bicolor E]|uniref:Uncharacterized protein n=1 Tax=Hyaloscypha bicolor E TaxID=1095630 RepID=A0A2J6TUL6_9HELO|nr:uncharacterized protein K444DRAFT_624191 [Hyaloscypha bicolor E]PMD66705.1 hypothetical protein K444DRAFT_624191 [Hyaloscypha bicolor E]
MIKESDGRVQDRAAVIAHPLDHMIKESGSKINLRNSLFSRQSEAKIKQKWEVKEEKRRNEELKGRDEREQMSEKGILERKLMEKKSKNRTDREERRHDGGFERLSVLGEKVRMIATQ